MEYLEGDVIEEGQEEWLSEGVLTDDDYNNPESQQIVEDQSGLNLADSQDETMASASADDSQMEIQQTDNQQHIVIQQINNQQHDNQHIIIQQIDNQELDGQQFVIHQVDNQQTDNKHIVYQRLCSENIVFQGLNDQQFVIQQTDGNQQIVIQQLDNQQLDSPQFVIQQAQAQQLNNSQIDSNIEETLNNFENTQNDNQTKESDLPVELSTFLTRKSKPGRAGSSEQKEVEDDGNDTDDLLRVLGDGDQKDKDRVKKGNHGADSTEEEDSFVFENKKPKNYQAAKNVLIRAAASRAVPEDDLTDCSSDETSKPTIARTKSSTPKSVTQSPTISTNDKPGVLTITPSVAKKVTKKIVHVPIPKTAPPIVQKNTSMKQYTNKRLPQGPSLLKTNPTKLVEIKKEIKVPSPKDIGKDNLNEDQDANTNEKVKAKTSEVKKSEQRIMNPELMDEEVPSDADSDEDDDCLYDELPSSDSEDPIDWFTLDIRAERAGDYLPLLGDRAYEILLEEKQRVVKKLETLKHSLRVLTDNGKVQAEKLKEATHTAAELDAMLRAT